MLTHINSEPLFLSCAEIDHTFDLASRRRALDILQEGKKTYHHQLFSGVEHGFAMRGDLEDPYQRAYTIILSRRILLIFNVIIGWVKEQSFTGIVNWFDFGLSQ